jgi:hypothetical protein
MENGQTIVDAKVRVYIDRFMYALERKKWRERERERDALYSLSVCNAVAYFLPLAGGP